MPRNSSAYADAARFAKCFARDFTNNGQAFPPAAWFAKRDSADFVYNSQAFPPTACGIPKRAGSSHASPTRRSPQSRRDCMSTGQAVPPPAASNPERADNGQPFPPAARFAKRYSAHFVYHGQAFPPTACGSSKRADSSHASQALRPQSRRHHSTNTGQALPPPASSNSECVNNGQPFPPASRFTKRNRADFVYNGRAFTLRALGAALFSSPDRMGSSRAFQAVWHFAQNCRHLTANGPALAPRDCASSSTPECAGSSHASPPPRHSAQGRQTTTGAALTPRDRTSFSNSECVNNGQPFPPAARLTKRDCADFVYNGQAFTLSTCGATLFSSPDRVGSSQASQALRHNPQSRRHYSTSTGQALPPPASSNSRRVNNGQPFPPAARFAKRHSADFVYNGQASTLSTCGATLFSSPDRVGSSQASQALRHHPQSRRHYSTSTGQAFPPRASSTPQRVNNGQLFPPAARFAKRHSAHFVYNGQASTLSTWGAALFSSPGRADSSHASPTRHSPQSRRHSMSTGQALAPRASSNPERANNGQPCPPAARFAKSHDADFVYNGQAFFLPACGAALFSRPDRPGSSHASPPPRHSAQSRAQTINRPALTPRDRTSFSNPEPANNGQPFPPAARLTKRDCADFVYNGQAFTLTACSATSSGSPDRAGSSPESQALRHSPPSRGDCMSTGQALPPPASSTPERVNNGQPFPPAARFAKRHSAHFVYNSQASTLSTCGAALFSSPDRADSSHASHALRHSPQSRGDCMSAGQALPPPASSNSERINDGQPFPPAARFTKRQCAHFVYNGQAFTLRRPSPPAAIIPIPRRSEKSRPSTTTPPAPSPARAPKRSGPRAIAARNRTRVNHTPKPRPAFPPEPQP